MYQSDDKIAIEVVSVEATARATGAEEERKSGTIVAASAYGSTKDAGRVRIGAGMMPFHSVKDAGRARFGAGMIQF